MQLARLNHVLVPSTKTERDRQRNGWLLRRFRALGWLLARLSRDGRALLAMAAQATVFAADLERTQSHVLVLATAALLTSALLFTRAYRLTGVTASVRAPRRVSLGDQVTVTISLHNEGPREQRFLRVEPPFLSWDGRVTELPEDVEVLAAGATRSAVFKARFLARGEHQLEPFRVARLLPLGIAQGPQLASSPVRFVVVPKVAHVASLGVRLSRREKPDGLVQLLRSGDASDLLGVRPYRPGDPVRDLHARSWARTGSPMVREYQEQYFTRMAVVVDTAPSARNPAQLEAGLSLAAGVVAHLGNGETVVDLWFPGSPARSLALGRGLGGLDRALDALAAVHGEKSFSPEGVLGQILPRAEQLASLVFIALGWDDARRGFVNTLRSRGVHTLALLVGGQAAASGEITSVAVDDIERGRELWL